MSTAIAAEGRLLAHDVYTLIQTLDPAVFRAELEAQVQQLAERITRRLEELQAACERLETREAAAFREAMGALARQLEALEQRARASLGSAPSVDWRGLFKALQPRYDALVTRLGAFDAHLDLPTLRPTNMSRSLFHMSNGFVSLAAILFLPVWLVRAIPATLTVMAWTAETLRRFSPTVNAALMRAFAPIAHAHESHRVNSATWYSTALILIATFCPMYACAAAVMVLGLADPAAAAVGRRWGKIKLRAGRSLEGTLAFALVGSVTAFAVLGLFYSGQFGSLGLIVLASLATGVAGAIAELGSGRVVDDNLAIPIASAFAAWSVLG